MIKVKLAQKVENDVMINEKIESKANHLRLKYSRLAKSFKQ